MVVHLVPGDDGPPLVGFVVSKAVGNAVHRNLVKRRLRAATSDLLGLLPWGSLVVVRALPAAAGETYDRLARDLRGCLEKAVARATAGSPA